MSVRDRDVKRRRRIRNLDNKVQWGIKNGQLDKKPKLKSIYNLLSKSDLAEFEQHINMVITSTQKRVAPRYLQFSGGFVALLIMILGAVAITQDEAVVGIVLFILGLLFGGLGFWYRDQLIRRGWKKIAQEFKIYFKELRAKHPGVGFEFHEQGHHTRKTKKKGKTVKEQSMSIWYSRYIVIYLPGDQSLWQDKYVEDKRSADKIVAGDSRPVKSHKELLDEEPVVLPYWWAMAKTRDGKVYYINNLKQMTQWSPPTLEQIETEKEELHEILAPPDAEESIEESDFDDFEDEEEQNLLDHTKQKPTDHTSINDDNDDEVDDAVVGDGNGNNVNDEIGGDTVDGVGSADDANNGGNYRDPNTRNSRRGQRRNDSRGGRNDSTGERNQRGNSRGRSNQRSSKKRRGDDNEQRRSKPRDSSKRRRGDSRKRGGDDSNNRRGGDRSSGNGGAPRDSSRRRQQGGRGGGDHGERRRNNGERGGSRNGQMSEGSNRRNRRSGASNSKGRDENR